jgi:hypothetical protein
MNKKYIICFERYDGGIEEVECYLRQNDVKQITNEINGSCVPIYEYKTAKGRIITSDRILSLELS